MNVSGWLNGHFLSFSGSDAVKVINQDSDGSIALLNIDYEGEEATTEPSKVVSSISTLLVIFVISLVALNPKKRKLRQK
jgi:hypothetical protein